MDRRNALKALALPVATAGCLRLESGTESGDDAAGGGGGGSADGSSDGEGGDDWQEGDGTGGDGGSGDGSDEGDGGSADESDESGDDGGDRELDDGEIEHSYTEFSTEGNDEVVAAHPRIDFGGGPRLNDSVEFAIENLDTDDRVRVTIVDDQDVAAAGAAFPVYDPVGTLRSSAVLPVRAVDGGIREFEAEVAGDEATFSAEERATYRVSAIVDGERVATTSPRPITVGHRKEFDYRVGEEYLYFGFNAGTLPTDADLHARFAPDVAEREYREVEARYEADADRFVARVPADQVQGGEHDGRIGLFHPDTGFADIELSQRFTTD